MDPIYINGTVLEDEPVVDDSDYDDWDDEVSGTAPEDAADQPAYPDRAHDDDGTPQGYPNPYYHPSPVIGTLDGDTPDQNAGPQVRDKGLQEPPRDIGLDRGGLVPDGYTLAWGAPGQPPEGTGLIADLPEPVCDALEQDDPAYWMNPQNVFPALADQEAKEIPPSVAGDPSTTQGLPSSVLPLFQRGNIGISIFNDGNSRWGISYDHTLSVLPDQTEAGSTVYSNFNSFAVQLMQSTVSYHASGLGRTLLWLADNPEIKDNTSACRDGTRFIYDDSDYMGEYRFQLRCAGCETPAEAFVSGSAWAASTNTRCDEATDATPISSRYYPTTPTRTPLPQEVLHRSFSKHLSLDKGAVRRADGSMEVFEAAGIPYLAKLTTAIRPGAKTRLVDCETRSALRLSRIEDANGNKLYFDYLVQYEELDKHTFYFQDTYPSWAIEGEDLPSPQEQTERVLCPTGIVQMVSDELGNEVRIEYGFWESEPFERLESHWYWFDTAEKVFVTKRPKFAFVPDDLHPQRESKVAWRSWYVKDPDDNLYRLMPYHCALRGLPIPEGLRVHDQNDALARSLVEISAPELLPLLDQSHEDSTGLISGDIDWERLRGGEGIWDRLFVRPAAFWDHVGEFTTILQPYIVSVAIRAPRKSQVTENDRFGLGPDDEVFTFVYDWKNTDLRETGPLLKYVEFPVNPNNGDGEWSRKLMEYSYNEEGTLSRVDMAPGELARWEEVVLNPSESADPQVEIGGDSIDVTVQLSEEAEAEPEKIERRQYINGEDTPIRYRPDPDGTKSTVLTREGGRHTYWYDDFGQITQKVVLVSKKEQTTQYIYEMGPYQQADVLRLSEIRQANGLKTRFKYWDRRQHYFSCFLPTVIEEEALNGDTRATEIEYEPVYGKPKSILRPGEDFPTTFRYAWEEAPNFRNPALDTDLGEWVRSDASSARCPCDAPAALIQTTFPDGSAEQTVPGPRGTPALVMDRWGMLTRYDYSAISGVSCIGSPHAVQLSPQSPIR